MTLKNWLKRHRCDARRNQLARDCNTTLPYLLQLSNPQTTGKYATAKMCKHLYFSTSTHTPDSVIVPKDMRPDLADIMALGVDLPKEPLGYNEPQRSAA